MTYKWHGYFLGSFRIPPKLVNFCNPNHSPTNCRNSGRNIKWNWTAQQEIFDNLVYLVTYVLYSFRKFWKMLLNSALEISENSNRNIWSNGRHLLAENLSCEQILMSRQPAEFNSYFLLNACKLETATEYQNTYMYRHATDTFNWLQLF